MNKNAVYKVIQKIEYIKRMKYPQKDLVNSAFSSQRIPFKMLLFQEYNII